MLFVQMSLLQKHFMSLRNPSVIRSNRLLYSHLNGYYCYDPSTQTLFNTETFDHNFRSKRIRKRLFSCTDGEKEKQKNNNNETENNIITPKFHWSCKHTWREASINTGWCLLGCSIGDFGTMVVGSAFFPEFANSNPWAIMALATINGLSTSVLLETIVLYQRNRGTRMTVKQAASTALGMSFLSMIGMETAMNLTDYCIVGAANVTVYSVLPSMVAGFVVPLPYNYWRLKKHGKACH